MPPDVTPAQGNATAQPEINPQKGQPEQGGQDPAAAQGGQQNANRGAQGDTALTQGGSEAIKRFKIKVDGNEEEIDEPEIVRRAQLGTAAYKRMEEAAKATQRAEGFMNLLRTKFTDLLDHPDLGLDEGQKRQMVEDWYKRKYIEPETLTPEQRHAKEQEAELQRYRDQEKTQKQQQDQQRMRELEEFHTKNIQKTIVEALSTEGLPKTEYTARRMAELMMKNKQLGLDLPAQHLATLVREDYMAEQKALYQNSDGETLLKLMGDDIVNKIRKADLARLTAGNFNPKPTGASSAPAPSEPGKQQYKRLEDYQEDLMKKLSA